MFYILILVLLSVGGFVIGFTHEKKWQILAGLHGAAVCLLIGIVSAGLSKYIQCLVGN